MYERRNECFDVESNTNLDLILRKDISFSVHFIGHWGAGFVEICQYRNWPGSSPTVHISWFIAKAYLANFYYTTRRDYGKTIEICDEVIATYNQSLGNGTFADRGFLVELSTRWAGVYDRHIQALLGLCSLGAFVSGRSTSRSVCSGVRPVDFVRYLKQRSLVKLARWDKVDLDTDDRFENAVHNGFVLLKSSLKIMELGLISQAVS